MKTAQTRFRAVALLGLIAAIAQVTLGGIVRVTGSGDACPDWPLCHGQLIPPLDYHTMLEYSHRLSATVVGLLVVIALYLAWRHYRGSSPAVISTSAGTILVIAAAILGGLTVLSELTWWVRLIHLGLAELVVASMAVAWLSGGPAGEDSSEQVIERPRIRFDRTLMWATIVGVMVMILYGSYIVGAGYGSSCGSWPLCQGWGIPRGIAFEAHMGHRYFAVILFALVAGMGHVAWRRGAVDGELRWLTVLTGGFLVAEILVGAFTVWLGFTAAMKSLHLTVATLMWASAVLLAAVYLRPDRFRVPSWRVESVAS
ncbi:MAG: heme A synthase [Dehalococcoidia bacterium]|nr:heme A synthase [Dehalococcoidia bacterium]